MRSITQELLGIVAAGFAATSILAASLPLAASAEPTFTPDGNDLIGVGGDVTANVMDVIAEQ